MESLKLNTIINGEALSVLKGFADECVDCTVTSPPYWLLRSYGDLDEELGREDTLGEYLQSLLRVFREVYRVLKPTGTCWVNIGDKYKDGSLCLIPDRFAIMMKDIGWIPRNEVIWHKPNAVPEAVTNRFTVDHEKLFFFVKSKEYYFEQQFEPRKTDVEVEIKGRLRYQDEQNRKCLKANTAYKNHGGHLSSDEMKLRLEKGRNVRTVRSIAVSHSSGSHVAPFPEELITIPILAGCPVGGTVLDMFMGQGTTAVVARRLRRNYIGIELNPGYVREARERIEESERETGATNRQRESA